MQNGESYMGELWDENISDNFESNQVQLKIGNRDIYGRDFIWLNQKNITNSEYKENAVTFERMEYGNFYGVLKAVYVDGRGLETSMEDIFETAQRSHDTAMEISQKIEEIRLGAAELMTPTAELQREIALIEISGEGKSKEGMERIVKLKSDVNELENKIAPQIAKFNNELENLSLIDQGSYLKVKTASGQVTNIQLSSIVRFYQPNKMGVFGKTIHYFAKVWEFIAGSPRESNTEGGVFPAIFGTVLMVILMSIAVVPIGVMAAIYLNEYANQGAIVRFIRLSVNNLAGVPSIVFGVFGLGFFVYVVGGSIDQLLFSDTLPEPTFGTGGILWASLTLALLTLPVVVVATEEGILAVPRANKEGALALGSTKWQMIRKIILPNAMPGILTGLILAISRGAGEVAPLMITGVVKLAPSLALDWTFPFLHLDRKFMHLGFHIYDVGFQSPNVEAAKPMVYSTALLLIIIVVLLNLIAIYIRNNLRKKFKTATF